MLFLVALQLVIVYTRVLSSNSIHGLNYKSMKLKELPLS